MIPYVVDHGNEWLDFGAQLTVPTMAVGDQLYFIVYSNFADDADLTPDDPDKIGRLFAWNLIPNTFNTSYLCGYQIVDPSVEFTTTGFAGGVQCLWVIVRAADSGVGYINGLGVGSFAYNETNTPPTQLIYGGNNNFHLGNSPNGEVLVVRMVIRTSESGTRPGVDIPGLIEQEFVTESEFYNFTTTGAIGAGIEAIPISEPSIDASLAGDTSYSCRLFVVAVTNYDINASPQAAPPGVAAPVGSSVLPVSGSGLPSNSSSISNDAGDELVSEDGNYLVWEA